MACRPVQPPTRHYHNRRSAGHASSGSSSASSSGAMPRSRDSWHNAAARKGRVCEVVDEATGVQCSGDLMLYGYCSEHIKSFTDCTFHLLGTCTKETGCVYRHGRPGGVDHCTSWLKGFCPKLDCVNRHLSFTLLRRMDCISFLKNGRCERFVTCRFRHLQKVYVKRVREFCPTWCTTLQCWKENCERWHPSIKQLHLTDCPSFLFHSTCGLGSHCLMRHHVFPDDDSPRVNCSDWARFACRNVDCPHVHAVPSLLRAGGWSRDLRDRLPQPDSDIGPVAMLAVLASMHFPSVAPLTNAPFAGNNGVASQQQRPPSLAGQHRPGTAGSGNGSSSGSHGSSSSPIESFIDIPAGDELSSLSPTSTHMSLESPASMGSSYLHHDAAVSPSLSASAAAVAASATAQHHKGLVEELRCLQNHLAQFLAYPAVNNDTLTIPTSSFVYATLRDLQLLASGLGITCSRYGSNDRTSFVFRKPTSVQAQQGQPQPQPHQHQQAHHHHHHHQSPHHMQQQQSHHHHHHNRPLQHLPQQQQQQQPSLQQQAMAAAFRSNSGGAEAVSMRASPSAMLTPSSPSMSSPSLMHRGIPSSAPQRVAATHAMWDQQQQLRHAASGYVGSASSSPQLSQRGYDSPTSRSPSLRTRSSSVTGSASSTGSSRLHASGLYSGIASSAPGSSSPSAAASAGISSASSSMLSSSLSSSVSSSPSRSPAPFDMPTLASGGDLWGRSLGLSVPQWQAAAEDANAMAAMSVLSQHIVDMTLAGER